MESRNLIIRESVFEDCRYFAEWEADPEVTRYFNISDHQGYGEVVRKFILDDEDSMVMQFTIVTKADNTPVGRILVTDINREEDSLDLTRIYIADKANRGRGYGTEALSAFLEYAFINLHMERVTVDFIRDNDTADRLFRKQRFEKKGTARSGCKKNGRYYDLQLMALLRAEFFEKQRHLNYLSDRIFSGSFVYR